MDERTVKVTLKGDVSDFNRALLGASATAKAFSRELDTGTDRATNLTQSILAVGPALVPLGAAGVPILAGLSNQFAFTAVGAGTMALAFSGVGDALKATNDYAIEPTDANLKKMRQSLAELGPAGRDFVGFLQELRPRLQELQNLAQEGLLPGAEAGIQDLMTRLPEVERIVSTVATALGDLFAEAGSNLADPRWDEFFAFLQNEARPTLINLGRSLGNLAEGFANLWMAFQPLSDDFSRSFLQLSRDFAAWTDGLDQTEGFQEFIAYIQENGPKVWDTLGAIGNALLQIVEAAAPVGSAALPAIKAVADAIATVADSDLGPVIIGVVSLTSALSRLKALGNAANTSALGGIFGKTAYAGTLTAARQLPGALLAVETATERANTKAGALSATSTRLGTSLRGTAKLAGGAGGLAFVLSGLDEKMGLSNTATLALAGSMAGPWGAAVGAGVGLALDLAAAEDELEGSMRRADEATKNSSLSLQQQIAAQDAALAAVARRREELEARDAASSSGHGDRFAAPSGRNESAIRDLDEKSKKLLATRRELEHAAEDQAFAEAGLADSMAFATNQTRAETLAMLENIKAKNNAADAAENAFSAETNYRQALKDAKKQADSNSVGIKGNSDAALKNREALDRLATGWNRVADAGNASTKDMRKAKASFIDVAESMGVSRAAAKRLADELFHIPSPHPRVVLEGVAGALTQIQHVKDRLLDLNGTTAQTFVQIKESIGKKDGGLVRHYDSGGFVSGAGGPRDDLIDAKLSNGEFVVNAAATARNLSLLHEINSQRYAGGGFVQTTGNASATALLERPNVPVQIDVHPRADQSEVGIGEEVANRLAWRLGGW